MQCTKPIEQAVELPSNFVPCHKSQSKVSANDDVVLSLERPEVEWRLEEVAELLVDIKLRPLDNAEEVAKRFRSLRHR